MSWFGRIGKIVRSAVKVGEKVRSSFKVGQKAYSTMQRAFQHPSSVSASDVLNIASEGAKSVGSVLHAADDLGKKSLGDAYGYTPAALITSSGADALDEAGTAAGYGSRLSKGEKVSAKEWTGLARKSLRTGGEFGLSAVAGKAAGKMVKNSVAQAVIKHHIGEALND